MNYCIDSSVDEPIMLINKHIGYDKDEGYGVNGSLFQEELLQLDNLGKKRIQIWINSPGGIVMEGYNIYSAILKSKTKVDTYCVGIAASIAAVIFQAGRNRVMADYSCLMYHNPFGGTNKELDVMKNSIATMVASRAGKTSEEVLKVMDRTTWINANDALESGFCDSIESSSEHNKKRGQPIPEINVPGEGMEAMNLYKVSNSFLNSNKQSKMNKVTNKLGLNPDANEESILSAISAIENKLSKATNDLSISESEVEKKVKEVNALTERAEAAEKKVSDAELAATEAKNSAKLVAVNSMLDGFVASGRIKADAKDSWAETSNAIGVDKVKAMIEALPVTKIANKLPVSDVANETALTNVVAGAMGSIRTKMGL